MSKPARAGGRPIIERLSLSTIAPPPTLCSRTGLYAAAVSDGLNPWPLNLSFMQPTLQKCMLVVRKPDDVVKETRVEVSSLEQLYERCLMLEDEHLLERFVVEGRDRAGRRRALVLDRKSVV